VVAGVFKQLRRQRKIRRLVLLATDVVILRPPAVENLAPEPAWALDLLFAMFQGNFGYSEEERMRVSSAAAIMEALMERQARTDPDYARRVEATRARHLYRGDRESYWESSEVQGALHAIGLPAAPPGLVA
jgi:hypothetical protein